MPKRKRKKDDSDTTGNGKEEKTFPFNIGALVVQALHTTGVILEGCPSGYAAMANKTPTGQLPFANVITEDILGLVESASDVLVNLEESLHGAVPRPLNTPTGIHLAATKVV